MSGGPSDTSSDVHAEIRRLRQARGWSHDVLAEKLGVPHRQTVIRWEKDAVPSRRYARALVEVLGVPEHLLSTPKGARRDRLARLEAEVADLTVALDAARRNHERLLRRVSALEKAQTRSGARAKNP